MRLTFTYADKPDLSLARRDNIYSTSLSVPDDALHLIGIKDRVLVIGELAASFTQAYVYLTCNELDFKHYPLPYSELGTESKDFFWEDRVLILGFWRFARPSSEYFKILFPSPSPLPDEDIFRLRFDKKNRDNLRLNLISNQTMRDQDHKDYVDRMKKLAEQLLMLINAAPSAGSTYSWAYEGFHPWWKDKILSARHSQQSKKYHKSLKQREHDEAKRLKREETIKARADTITDPNAAPQHGAGRRPGARPGIYKGVSMRSQLEIRFAAELDERNIRWFYESEALGDAGYLVDFYLPDLGVWVEVKGTIIAKDRQVLPDVAKHLKQTRQHRLMMYTQSKAYVINPSGFREIEAKKFWDELVK